MKQDIKKIAKAAAKQAAIETYRAIMKQADDSAQTGENWERAIVVANRFLLPAGAEAKGKGQDGKAEYYVANNKWYVVYVK
jgi:hypothetical protein